MATTTPKCFGKYDSMSSSCLYYYEKVACQEYRRRYYHARQDGRTADAVDTVLELRQKQRELGRLL